VHSAWGTIRGLSGYEETFTIFPEGIPSFLEGRQDAGEPASILDFMGFATFADDLIARHIPYHAIISVSLGYPQESQEVKDTNLRLSKLDHVTGNVVYEESWSALDHSMRELGVRKFGLIFWAPHGGFDCIPQSSSLYNALWQRLWDRLDVGGVLLAEIPGWVSRDGNGKFSDWQKKLSRQFHSSGSYEPFSRVGYATKTNMTTLSIRKTKMNPTLPAFDI
jgi:hypothetical protein